MNTITNQNTLNFEESAEAGRVSFPLQGRPFALVMQEMSKEDGLTGRLLR